MLMEVGYALKGKWLGEDWRSNIFTDAEDCSSLYWGLINDKDYASLKEHIVYMHFEEIVYE